MPNLNLKQEKMIKMLTIAAGSMMAEASNQVDRTEKDILYKDAMRKASKHFQDAWTELINACNFYGIE